MAPLRTYAVVRGDSLNRIAARLGLTWREVYALNASTIGPTLQVHAGQVLTLPAIGSVETLADDGPSWQPAGSTGDGMVNPMTTAGDLIYGYTDGVPDAIHTADGDAGSVLTLIDSGSGVLLPRWV